MTLSVKMRRAVLVLCCVIVVQLLLPVAERAGCDTVNEDEACRADLVLL